MAQNSRNGIADRSVGYSYIDIDHTDTYNLRSGVDDAGDSVAIPDDATGALITVEHTSTAPVIRVSTTAGEPDIATNRGTPIYEDGSVILVGSTAEHFANRTELDLFKVVIDTGKTARLHVNFISNRQ